MDETETSLLQENYSSRSQSDDEAENNKRRNKDLDVSLLPFCFVTIWPKDATPQYLLKEAIKMFEKKDQQHLHLSEKIREKVLERQLVIGRLEDLKYNLRKLNQKIGQLLMANAKRDPPEDVDSHAVCDELMEKKKEEKQALEAKIKEVEKEFEDIKEEIWCNVDHLKEKHHRNEASVCTLDRKKIRGKDRWFFIFCDLESIGGGITSMNTSSDTL